MRRFVIPAVLYLSVLALAAVVVGMFDGASGPAAPGHLDEEDLELAAALQPFDGCEDLLAYFQREGLERVGPYGLDAGPFYGYAVDDVVALESAGGAESAGADRAAVAGQAAPPTTGDGDTAAFSGTNVQEAGVDEPDTVKTDGDIVAAMAGERLHVLGLRDGDLRRLGSLRLREAWGSELFLDGDRVLVLGRSQGSAVPLPRPMVERGMVEGGMVAPDMASPVTTLRMVDISDPSTPVVSSTLTMDGDYLSARLIDGVARVVLRSQPVALPFVMPEGGGLRAERRATEVNRDVIRGSTIDQWLPYAVATDEGSGVETERSLVDCSRVHAPERFSGFGMVSVVSVDLGGALGANGAAGVVGQAETVYASPGNLYVALNDWGMPVDVREDVAPAAPKTDIHQFDIADPTAARYVASGRVRGRLLNQWAMSEHDGHLRVATTLDSMTGRDPSESAVVILREVDGALEPQGRIAGLGKTEQIYAVRYDGPIGYVVTFRQTDPLYTLDLSDPQNPRELGALKINGYSAYLHPVGEGRILGVGQDAKADGQVIGSQVSLFDVSDLRDPRRVDQIRLGQGSSTVEHDHRAFLHWPETGTVVVPLQTWTRKPFVGAVVLDVDRNSVTRRGRISHEPGSRGRGASGSGSDVGGDAVSMPEGAMITRSLVIDDNLLTVSDAGVLVSGLDDLRRRDWVDFGR